MLPYFNVALAETFRMPRKRNVDVPVHRGNSETSQPIHKTFSANFNSRRKQKTVEFADTQTFEQDNNAHINDEPEKETKITKKSLCKEIERLSDENAVLLERLAGAESVCSKKIARMREKVMTLQDYYEQLQTENGNLKAKHQELLDAYEGVKAQLKIDKQCESCEQLKKIVEKGNEEYNLLRSNNKDLLDDISMLKNVVYRLNVQMERYQDKLRKSNVRPQLHSAENTNNPETLYCVDQQQQVLSDHADHGHTPISWGKVNAHTLGPLLDSYQETIEEKDDVIASYEKELSNFTGRIKEILSENEALHRRLTDDDQCSKKLTEELETARAELKGAKEQNDILIKKCALKQDKVEEILRCYEQKVDQLQRDYKVVHEEYIRSRSEIVALKEKNKALLEAKEDFKHEKENYIPLSVHAASINECKRLYEELKGQYEKEKSKLEENICSQNREMLELNNKISSLAKEKEELENKIKNLEKHVKKSEAKYLELQQTVKEIQISRTACRKQLHKAMTFAKDLVLEQETLLKALNQRHQENKVVKKLGTDIATRMDTLKSQLKNVQRDAWQELTTVEQRLQEQNSLIDTMKQEHSEEVERLKEIIRRKETDGAGNEPSSIPIPHYLLLRDRHT